MARTQMPRDDNSQSIQVLRFRTGGAHREVVSSSSPTLVALGSGVRVITVCADNPCYFETGDASVMASSSSHYLAASLPYDMALGSGLSDISSYHTHISIRAVSTSAVVYISERE
jgi:hypothetical protein